MKSKRLSWLFRLAFLLVILAVIASAVLVLRGRWQALVAGYHSLIDGGDTTLNPAERLFLQTYLTSRTEQLGRPAAPGTGPISFVIDSGQSADIIAANLATAGLLTDTELFINYVRFHGLDSELEAGEFVLTPRLTIPEMAAALTQAFVQETELRFVEGWRLEEMADYLMRTSLANIRARQFLDIVQRQDSFDFSGYDFLASLPAGASLEGFLFPDTYRLPLEADAEYLVDAMLRNFGRRVTPAMRQSYGVLGLSLREAVTLASIVEREAVVAEERRLIASVFYNRLAQGMKLEADPTTQYALGYQAERESWWKTPLFLDDLQFDSPYNTYVVAGLPPGPIANPGLSSLQAVADPATSAYLFFVVDCTASVSGEHAFSLTYEEHLVNVSRCR